MKNQARVVRHLGQFTARAEAERALFASLSTLLRDFGAEVTRCRHLYRAPNRSRTISRIGAIQVIREARRVQHESRMWPISREMRSRMILVQRLAFAVINAPETDCCTCCVYGEEAFS